MVTVNGTEQRLMKATTIKKWLDDKKLNIELVAIEHNGELLTKDQYEERILKQGDNLEVISFVGGG